MVERGGYHLQYRIVTRHETRRDDRKGATRRESERDSGGEIKHAVERQLHWRFGIRKLVVAADDPGVGHLQEELARFDISVSSLKGTIRFEGGKREL